MTENIYIKENKASRKQAIKMQLAFLDDSLCKNALEKLDIMSDIVILNTEYDNLQGKE
tara:strand:+ start:69 stop:242 length:174 start_codon:yes stop_codon:yes gene_type:complete